MVICTCADKRENAKLLGLDQGRDTVTGGVGIGKTPLSSTQWQLVIMIFYVGLVLFQVPGCIGEWADVLLLFSVLITTQDTVSSLLLNGLRLAYAGGAL